MDKKVGRNDPCSCGSGKKYKQCCMTKGNEPPKITFKAKVLGQQKQVNLLHRTFGNAIDQTHKDDKPPTPPSLLEEK
ncbi:MAG: SEC-C domain-containing protein [Chlamydiia bacterium]|nr:SEC-C domain-containing protein [Chlamydiia bacterium]